MKKFLIVCFSICFLIIGAILGIICYLEPANYISSDVYADSNMPTEWVDTNIYLADQLSFVGKSVWTDGTNYYYSTPDNHYIWSYEYENWLPKIWSGYTDFDGIDIWTDGTNYYYSNDTQQYVLNGTTWSDITWTGLTSFSGRDVWHYGTITYYSYDTAQYVLNGTTWSEQTWRGSNSIRGRYINFYSDTLIIHSNGNSHYMLNYDLGMWQVWTFYGRTNINGFNVWYFNGYSYYDTSTYHYKYILDTNTWESVSWSGVNNNFGGDNVFIIGNHAYFSNNLVQFEFDFANTLQISRPFYVLTTFTSGTSAGAAGGSAIWHCKVYNTSTNLYTTYTYFSAGTRQYVFNDTLGLFVPKTWTGLTDFNGTAIWYYGNDVYCSWVDIDATRHNYILDTTTSTWSSISFGAGYHNIYGVYVWYDDTNTYLSDGTAQYVFNGNAWSFVYWTGLTDFYGVYVWTDGTNYYYSHGTQQYVLNGTTWSVKDWYGLTNFYGSEVWNYGNFTFYTYNYLTYILDTTTSTWTLYNWQGSNIIRAGGNVWLHNNICYYSGLSYYTWQLNYMPFQISLTGRTLSWSYYDNASYYYVYKDGEYLTQTIGNTFNIDSIGSYYVVAYNEYNVDLITSNTLYVSISRLSTPDVSINRSILSWHKVANADYYDIYILRDNNYVLFDSVSSTSYVLTLTGTYVVSARSVYTDLYLPSLISVSFDYVGVWTPTGTASDYSFATLIGVIVDTPIYYITQLFDFDMDFLGFNMLSLIKALFTLCVIIWLVRLILARGK